MSERRELICNVRQYSGTYIARCNGKQASCTASEEQAAKAAGVKALKLPHAQIFLKAVTDNQFLVSDQPYDDLRIECPACGMTYDAKMAYGHQMFCKGFKRKPDDACRECGIKDPEADLNLCRICGGIFCACCDEDGEHECKN